MGGCVESKSIPPEVTNQQTPIPTETNMAVIETTQRLNETINKIPELKIMSVSTSQQTQSAIPINIKVKNIGNATAKEVYAGVVGIAYSPENPDLYKVYASNNTEELKEFAHKVWLEGTAYKETGFYLTTKDTRIGNLTLTGKLIAQEYIGDINPDEIKTTNFDVPFGYKKIIDCPGNLGEKCSVSSVYGAYIKLAWTNDMSIYTVY